MSADMDMPGMGADMDVQHEMSSAGQAAPLPKSPSHEVAVGHDHCEYMGAPESKGVVVLSQGSPSGSCAQAPCDQSATAGSTAKSLLRVPHKALFLGSITAPTRSVSALRWNWIQRNISPPQLSAVDPLSVSLRV
jgi:hypothetical protein